MITLNNVQYYAMDNYYIVGDNSTSSADGISSKTFTGEITVAEKVNGKSVLEIAQYAFDGCANLKKVTIKAKLRSINQRAFQLCINLEYINIPSTLTYIGEASLYLGDGSTLTLSTPITVEFEQGRIEKVYIEIMCFTYRSKVSIIYPSNLVPLCNSFRAFDGSSDINICAPEEISFYSKTTTKDSSLCPSSLIKPKTSKRGCSCKCLNYKRHSNIILTTLMIVICSYQ